MQLSTAGDLGDAVFLLGILKELEGSPHTLLLEPSTITKFKTMDDVNRFHALFSPLARLQPYIADCRPIQPGDTPFWRSADFRAKFYTPGNTLMLAHLNHLIEKHRIGAHLKNVVGNSRWLEVEAAPGVSDRVVINRTNRYRNTSFNWLAVVRHYRHRLMFVGTHNEWREFIAEFGYVDYRQTHDLLEVARVIAGSALFIGNQSVPNAIAEGLKHRSIQETSIRVPDCIYHRDNAQYVTNGAMDLPDVAGSGVKHIDPPKPPTHSFNTQHTPPGGWYFRGQKMGLGFMGSMHRMMMQTEFRGIERSIVEGVLIEENVERCPEFFGQQIPDLESAAKLAIKQAAIRANSR